MTELDRLQKIADSQKREKIKIEGKIEVLLEDLVEEGYHSVDEAKKSIDILDKKLQKMEKVFEEKLTQFKEKYKQELEGTN